MQIEEHNKLIRLFDQYGKLLSAKQREVLDKYLNLDIAESELAELQGESRQSIHDAITKAKKQLFEFEEKCGFSQREECLKTELEKVKKLISLNQTKEAINLLNKINEKI